jgi:predicted component of type VI protein secretion system
MAELIIHSGKLQGKRLVLPDREVVIGRDDDCHVRLTSALVSRKHCALRSTPEGLWVRDLSSQNGTFVNDVPVIDPVLMKPGDVLKIGATLFLIPPVRKPAAEGIGVRAADKSDPISDADIASWLSDTSDELPIRASDTTVIKNAPSAPVAQPTTTTHAAAPTPVSVPAPAENIRRPPRSVKEQAAEIIRLHWAAVRGEEPRAS